MKTATKLAIILAITALLAIAATADKPLAGKAKQQEFSVKEIQDDENRLVYFYEGDHAFNIYLKEYKSKGDHQSIKQADTYQSIIQKSAKKVSFGWTTKVQANTKLVAEITSNYPLTLDGYKLKDDKYNINFQKEADNGWTIEFEQTSSTNWNVILYKKDYKGASVVTIDPVIAENVRTVYYTFTVCGNWTCNSYAACIPSPSGGRQNCLAVTGIPAGCTNSTFQGSFAPYNQSCDYCTPLWHCQTYTACNYDTGQQNCDAAFDQNNCYASTNASSDQYAGDLSEFRRDCGQGLASVLGETGTGIGSLVNAIRMPFGKFVLFLAVTTALIALVFGVLFAFKILATKHLK
jgi:hypothetical protein